MDDRVGGIYSHASDSDSTSACYVSTSEDTFAPTVPDKLTTTCSSFPTTCTSETTTPYHLLNGKYSVGNGEQGSTGIGNHSSSSLLEGQRDRIMDLENVNPDCAYVQTTPASCTSFLESDVSSALSALVEVDQDPVNGEGEPRVGQSTQSGEEQLLSLAENNVSASNYKGAAVGSDVSQNLSVESIEESTSVANVTDVIPINEGQAANAPESVTISVQQLMDSDAASSPGDHGPFAEATVKDIAPNTSASVPSEVPSSQVATASLNKEQQVKLNDATAQVNRIGLLQTANISVPDQSKRQPQASYHSPFDPSSRRSLKQRQKIHNIVDRLRTGAHTDGPVAAPGSQITSTVQTQTNQPVGQAGGQQTVVGTNNSPQSGNGSFSGQSAKPVVHVMKDALMTKARLDVSDGSMKPSLHGQVTLRVPISKHASPGLEAASQQGRPYAPTIDSGVQVVNRIAADSASRRSEFPQVMIQDVFSQSTGKRLTQRSQAVAAHYSPGSPMNANQHGISVVSSVSVPQIVATGTVIAGQHVQQELHPNNLSTHEEPMGQHYARSANHLPNHHVQADGTIAHQHHPKANINHFERPGQGVVRQYGQWSYSQMHNPISNLQHFVNQPNPSGGRQQTVNVQKQPSQAVVDLSSVQYGSSNSPIALHPAASDQSGEKEQSLPRLQPVNTPQGSSQIPGNVRATAHPSSRYIGPYASVNTAPYNRHMQPPRQLQAIRQSPVNSSQHQATQLYQVGPANSRDRSSGATAVVTMANKGMQYIPANNGSELTERVQYQGYTDYERVYQAQDVIKQIQNIQLPMPLPNFGGFLTTKGLEGPLYDSLSGYLIVPIKKSKDSSCQTEESCLSNDAGGYPRVRFEPEKTSVGCQAQTDTYLCASCLTEVDLEDSVQERFNSGVDLTCKVCAREFTSIGKLQNHKSKVHNIRLPFRCGECAIRFEDHASVVKHLASHNEENTCSTCGKAFQSKEILERHERLHKSPLQTCQFCSKQFKTALLLRKHVQELHWTNGKGVTNGTGYRSEVNNNVSAQSEDDYIHDGNDELFVLPDKSSSKDVSQSPVSRGRLNSQESSSECGEHYCHFCQIQFATDKYLLDHYLSYHRKGYGFQCPVCPRYVHLWSRLKKHIKDHGILPGGGASQEEEQQLERAEIASSGVNGPQTSKKVQHPRGSLQEMAKSMFRKTLDGRWECLKCGENFYSEVRVKNHLGTAHEERLYQCSICWLLFPHSTHLYWHMRDHKRKGDISEIPAKFVSQTQSMESDADSLIQKQSFKCKHCGENFLLERHLSSHLGQKHGYKVFTCQICGDKFNFSSRLVLHMKYHSSKQKAKLVARRQVTRSSAFKRNLNSPRSVDVVASMDDSDAIDIDMDSTTGRDDAEEDGDGNKTDDSNAKRTGNSFQNGFVYLCGFCNEGFSEEADFRQHMLGHQRMKKNFKCRLCGQQFASQTEADKHLEEHPEGGNGVRPSQDDISVEEQLEEDVIDEDELDGAVGNIWTSAFVGEGSRTEKDTNDLASLSSTAISDGNNARPLRSGQVATEETEEKEVTTVACPVCGKEFKTKPGRRMHMKTTHRISGMRHFAKMKERMKKRALACPICEKSFKTEGGTRLHLQNTHRLFGQQITDILHSSGAVGVLPVKSGTLERGGNNSENLVSPPGLQKLIITKAKGQNTLIVSRANEIASSKAQADNDDRDSNVRSPLPSPIRVLESSDHRKSTADFQCPFCEQFSSSVKGIRSHISRLHNVEVRTSNIWVLCEICNRNFYDQDRLAAHCSAAHQVSDDFQCPGCTAVYPRFSGMYTHIRRKHTAIKWKMRGMWSRCPQCGRSFYDKARLNEHSHLVHSASVNSKVLHKARAPMSPRSPVTSAEESSPARGKVGSFHCPTCDMVVNTIKGMQVHILKRHPKVEIKKWQFWEGCPLCGEYFFDVERLDRHNQDVHVLGKDVGRTRSIQRERTNLGKSADNTTESVEIHETGETAGGFQCPLCEEFYPKFMGVDAHLRQTHNVLNRKRKPVWSVCLFCEQHYYNEKALKRHVEEKHSGEEAPQNSTVDLDTSAHDGDVSGEVSMNVSSTAGKGGFQCPKCEVIIPSIKGMQVHMYRGHQRLKRKRWQEWLSCDQCGLHVYDAATLETHMSIHHGKTSIGSNAPALTGATRKSSKDVVNDSVGDIPKAVSPYDHGYMCPACPHICPKYAGIDTHIRVKHGYKAVHGKKYWITCHLCGLHLYSERNMDDHVATAHDGNFGDDEDVDIVEVEESVNTAEEEPRRLRVPRQVNTSTPKAVEEQSSAKVDSSQLSFEDSPKLSNDTISTQQTPLKSGALQSGYECPYCAKVYPKFLGVDAHIRQKHGPNKRKAYAYWIKCEDCGRYLCSDVHYQEHVKKHTAEPSDIEGEQDQAVSSSSMYESPSVGGESAQAGDLFLVEMSYVRRGAFLCPCCEHITNYKGIGVHLSKRHRHFPRKRAQLWSPCSHCNNFFFNDEMLGKHLQSAHNIEAAEMEVDKTNAASQESAEAVDDNFAEGNDDIELANEIETEGATCYHCPGCEKVFSLCRVINSHISRQHKPMSTKSTSEWLSCESCNSVFYDSLLLNEHCEQEHAVAKATNGSTDVGNVSKEKAGMLNGDSDIDGTAGSSLNADVVVTNLPNSPNVQDTTDVTKDSAGKNDTEENIPSGENVNADSSEGVKAPTATIAPSAISGKRKPEHDHTEEDPKMKVPKTASDNVQDTI